MLAPILLVVLGFIAGIALVIPFAITYYYRAKECERRRDQALHLCNVYIDNHRLNYNKLLTIYISAENEVAILKKDRSKAWGVPEKY